MSYIYGWTICSIKRSYARVKSSTNEFTYIHTYYMLVHNLQPKWYFLSSLMVAFSAGERPVVAEGSPPLWDRGPSKGNFIIIGEENSELGVAEALITSFEYSAGVMHLCRGCEAADFLCKALKIWMEVHCMWGYAPPKMKFWNLGSLRVCLLAIHISVSQGTN